MGDIRLREDTLRAMCTYKFILTGINKEGWLPFRSLWISVFLSPRKAHAIFLNVTYSHIYTCDDLQNKQIKKGLAFVSLL